MSKNIIILYCRKGADSSQNFGTGGDGFVSAGSEVAGRSETSGRQSVAHQDVTRVSERLTGQEGTTYEE